jgi:hypothetical protein
MSVRVLIVREECLVEPRNVEVRCQPEVVELPLGCPVGDSVHDERADASMVVPRIDLADGSYSIAALFSLQRRRVGEGSCHGRG